MNPLPWITSALGGIWGYVAAALVAAALAGGGVGYITYKVVDSKLIALRLADAESEMAAVKAGAAKQVKLDTATQTQAIAKSAAQVKVETVTRYITREIPVYVTAKQDAVSCVPFGFVRVLVGAARQTDPAALALPAGQLDDSCTALKWSDVAAGIASDYGTANANAEQLNALIASVRETDAITSAPAP